MSDTKIENLSKKDLEKFYELIHKEFRDDKVHQVLEDELRQRNESIINAKKRADLESEIKEAFLKENPEIEKAQIQVDFMIAPRYTPHDANKVFWELSGLMLIDNEDKKQVWEKNYFRRGAIIRYGDRFGLFFEKINVVYDYLTAEEIEYIEAEFESFKYHARSYNDAFLAGAKAMKRKG